jgi:hypothetical protein
MVIDDDVVVGLVHWWFLYPSFYIQGGRDYKEGNRVGYNMIPIRILYLPVYFTYISIDIDIYTLGEHDMVLWNLLNDGSSRIGPLLGPFESMRGGTLGTNPRQ